MFLRLKWCLTRLDRLRVPKRDNDPAKQCKRVSNIPMQSWGQVVSLASSCLPDLSTPHITIQKVVAVRGDAWATPPPSVQYSSNRTLIKNRI